MKRIISIAKKVGTDSFFKASSLVFVTSMVANVLAYLFQIVTGRLLPVEKYGEMNTLFAMFAVASVVITPFMSYFANSSAALYAEKRLPEIKGLFYTSFTRYFPVVALFFVVSAVFAPVISVYVSLPSYLIVAVIILVILNIALQINSGLIQGLHIFLALSVILIVPVFIKLILSVFTINLGLSIDGVVVSTGIGIILALLFSTIIILFKTSKEHERFAIPVKEVFSYLLPMMIANFVFSILSQFDVVLVKHYFSAYETGIYSSASIIGKAVMYLPGALILSLFPMVSAISNDRHKSLKLLFKALLMNSLLSGGGTIILLLFPKIIVSIFFGSKYLQAAPIVGLFAVAMFPLGMILIFMNYYMALKRLRFIVFLPISLFLMLGGTLVFHKTLVQVLYVILVSGLFTIFGFILMTLVEYRAIRKHTLQNEVL